MPEKGVTADDLMREVDGFYGHGKVLAFEMCVIDLAEANDLNLLELYQACYFLALSVAARIAGKSSDLEGSESLRKMRELGLVSEDEDPLS